jgi:hypothetical protein
MTKDTDVFLNENSMTTSTVSFEMKEYNATDYGCQLFLCLTCPFHFMPLFPGIMGKKRIILDEEEAVAEVECGLCSVNTRRPYGELGSVDKVNCLCCTGVSSELSKSIPMFVGWGCDDTRVSEIVAELKKRMKARGDTGQIQKAEMTLQEIKQLRVEMTEMKQDMKALLTHFHVAAPVSSPTEEMERV